MDETMENANPTLPNPPSEDPLVPEETLESAVQPNMKTYLYKTNLEEVQVLRRAANFIAAAMIFLSDNIFLKEKLTHNHIKKRIVGNWGTFPGLLTLVYAHLNRIIRKNLIDVLYVVKTGYGPPALLSCLWLEDSLGTLFPEFKRDHDGLKKLIKNFGGFPGQVKEETSGRIHEEGKSEMLGFSLAAILDDVNLVVACMISDDEAGTGPKSEIWQGFKLIDPAACGAVLPILHISGSRSSELTNFGDMDDKEIVSIFSGYGIQIRFVEGPSNIDNNLAASMDWAFSEIEKFQYAARIHKAVVNPRWPMLVLRTPIGLSGPKKVRGEYVEGPFHSGQVPFLAARTSEDDLQALEDWLSSFNPRELFSEYGPLLRVIPEANSSKLRWKPT